MTNFAKIWIFFPVVLGLVSCAKGPMQPEELEQFLDNPDNGFVKKLEVEGLRLTAQYLPTDRLMIREFETAKDELARVEQDTTLNTSQRLKAIEDVRSKVNTTRETYDKSLYFSLTVGYADEKEDIVYGKLRRGEQEYRLWLERLLFGLKERVYLQTATVEEIPLDVYQMDQTFGLTKYRKFLLVFPAESEGENHRSDEQKWINLRIKEFGLRTGAVTFQFDLPLDVPRLVAGF
jgi:hypothetical protein